MILSPRFFRSMGFVVLLAVALLPIACGTKQPQDEGESATSDEPAAAQPHSNGMPPDQFLAEFSAMAYTIDAPWDNGINVGARAHKSYESNQINLELVSPSAQSRVDQIALIATVEDGTMSPQMSEAFEQAVRLSFTAMDLQIPDSFVAAVRKGRSTTDTEAGRFSFYLMRGVGDNGRYRLSFYMNSR